MKRSLPHPDGYIHTLGTTRKRCVPAHYIFFFTPALILMSIHSFTASGIQWPWPSTLDPGMSCWYFPASLLMCCTPLTAPVQWQLTLSKTVQCQLALSKTIWNCAVSFDLIWKSASAMSLPLSTPPPSSWFLFWPCQALASWLLCWTLSFQWGSRYPCIRRMKRGYGLFVH